MRGCYQALAKHSWRIPHLATSEAMAAENEDCDQTLDKEVNDAKSSQSQIPDDVSEKHDEVPNEPDEEKAPQKPQTDGPGPPPNGGAAAWMQVLGAWMLFFNTWGILK